jgi:hypothetical protein
LPSRLYGFLASALQETKPAQLVYSRDGPMVSLWVAVINDGTGILARGYVSHS